MADPCMIDAYVGQLAPLLGPRRGQRVVAEVRDHLWEHAEHLMAAGRSPDDAENAAVHAFGDPTDLAREFNQQGGAMPSTFTRWSGLAGMVGTIGTAAAIAHYDAQKTPGEIDPTPVLAVVPWLLLLVGLAGLIVRTWGAFGRTRGRVAGVLIIAGLCLAPFGYGVVAGGAVAALLLVGFGLLFEVIFREAILPRPATALFAVSVVALSLMAPTSLEKQSAPYYIGFGLMVLSWLWLHYTLWSERPAPARVAA